MLTCPKCNGEIYRIPRRFIDRVFSQFHAIYRYKCMSPYCSWEGNYAQSKEISSTPRTDRGPS